MSGIPWLDRVDADAKAAGAARRENAQPSESTSPDLSEAEEVTGLDLYREHHGDGYAPKSAVRAMTHGEEVGTWNVFRLDTSEDRRGVPSSELPEDAATWLREHSR